MNSNDLKDILENVKTGDISVDEAITRLGTASAFSDAGYAKVDTHRLKRKGVPEVIYCEGKTPEEISGIVARLDEVGQNVLATRCTSEKFAQVSDKIEGLEFNDRAQCFFKINDLTRRGKGPILVLSAGTSDIPVAEEAALTAEVMGHDVKRSWDVGVAGLHRLLHHMDLLDEARVIIVTAGMEGALPSVVAGLVRVPVIAVPTSVGYGASFGGIAALLGMLNSCSGGVAVVNIDNGFGAGYLASIINALD